jgi:hypothetical protein
MIFHYVSVPKRGDVIILKGKSSFVFCLISAGTDREKAQQKSSDVIINHVLHVQCLVCNNFFRVGYDSEWVFCVGPVVDWAHAKSDTRRRRESAARFACHEEKERPSASLCPVCAMSLSPVWARNWLVWPERAEDDDNRQNAKIQSCSDYEDDEKKPLEDQPETGKDFDTSNKDSSDNELAKEEKNEADVIIIPATGECDNNWQVYTLTALICTALFCFLLLYRVYFWKVYKFHAFVQLKESEFNNGDQAIFLSNILHFIAAKLFSLL